jgi:hypothetical protein
MNKLQLGFSLKQISFILLAFLCLTCKKDEKIPPNAEVLQVLSTRVGTTDLFPNQVVENAPINRPIVISFTQALNRSSAEQHINITDSQNQKINVSFAYLDNDKTISLTPNSPLSLVEKYKLLISNQLQGKENYTFPGMQFEFITQAGELVLESLSSNDINFLGNNRLINVNRNFQLKAIFSQAVDPQLINNENIRLLRGSNIIQLNLNLSEDKKTLNISSAQPLNHLYKYNIRFSDQLTTIDKKYKFKNFSKSFVSSIDDTPKFPLLSDEALLTLVQEQTFKYFWDFGHPVSGLARERNNSGDVVTSGGSGFGIMSLIVGIERGFITRQQGIDRLEKIVNFLATADRFHGVWSHWLNGSTGKVVPFSTKDDGGDLVETSFLIQGLLTFRQYLNSSNTQENTLINKINQLWQGVEWDWHTRGGQDVLYWHWSPKYAWDMNLPIRGYNECLITYFLAAASPNHSIPASVYHKGWARNGDFKNGKSFYNHTLPLGYDLGGPLFFTHYSFLGLNPKNLTDQYANYWTQNVNHSLINRAYCVDNPQKNAFYSAQCWGLTASDNHIGYSAHSPTNDLGVISPTAALSSMPYTPEYSMEALKFFYYTLGDRLWGQYGFYDAFTPNEGWVADSFLAIDQGPIIIMIENHRTGLLWNLFMSCPEVANAKAKLGFN